jgi:hypothetical protein
MLNLFQFFKNKKTFKVSLSEKQGRALWLEGVHTRQRISSIQKHRASTSVSGQDSAGEYCCYYKDEVGKHSTIEVHPHARIVF